MCAPLIGHPLKYELSLTSWAWAVLKWPLIRTLKVTTWSFNVAPPSGQSVLLDVGRKEQQKIVFFFFRWCVMSVAASQHHRRACSFWWYALVAQMLTHADRVFLYIEFDSQCVTLKFEIKPRTRNFLHRQVLLVHRKATKAFRSSISTTWHDSSDTVSRGRRSPSLWPVFLVLSFSHHQPQAGQRQQELQLWLLLLVPHLGKSFCTPTVQMLCRRPNRDTHDLHYLWITPCCLWQVYEEV